MPVFGKEAARSVPCGPQPQVVPIRKQADTIELRVYPGANGSFTLYEDEGDSYNYETGSYATIPITYTDNPKNLVIGARTRQLLPGCWTNRVFKSCLRRQRAWGGIRDDRKRGFYLGIIQARQYRLRALGQGAI